MESAGRYVDMYWKMRDQYLEQRTFELFRAILQMLRYVMQFFADGKASTSALPLILYVWLTNKP
jgi:lipid-A-disaccharide synthase-like uncharacterized protein